MCDRSEKRFRQMSSKKLESLSQSEKTPARWTTEERDRLWHLRNSHSHLRWSQFHQLNFFPGRTQPALYHEYLRMEKFNTRKRLQSSRDKANSGFTARRSRASMLDSSGASVHKRPRLAEDDDEESNDDDGDIDNDGQTQRLQASSPKAHEKLARASDNSQSTAAPKSPTETQQVAASPAHRFANSAFPERAALAPAISPQRPRDTSKPGSTVQAPQSPAEFTSVRPESHGCLAQPSIIQTGQSATASAPAGDHLANQPTITTRHTALSQKSHTAPGTTGDGASHTMAPEPKHTINAPLVRTTATTATTTHTADSPKPNRDSTASSAPKIPLVSAKGMTFNQCIRAAAQYLHHGAQISELDFKARTDGEAQLEAENAALRQTVERVESSQSEVKGEVNELKRELSAFKEQLAAKDKLIEDLKSLASDRLATINNQMDEMKKEKEEMKKDNQKVMMLLQRLDKLSALDMLMGEAVMSQDSLDRQSIPTAEAA